MEVIAEGLSQGVGIAGGGIGAALRQVADRLPGVAEILVGDAAAGALDGRKITRVPVIAIPGSDATGDHFHGIAAGVHAVLIIVAVDVITVEELVDAPVDAVLIGPIREFPEIAVLRIDVRDGEARQGRGPGGRCQTRVSPGLVDRWSKFRTDLRRHSRFSLYGGEDSDQGIASISI